MQIFRVISAILLAAMSGCAPRAHEETDRHSTWAPDLDLIGSIEAAVVLPEDHLVSEYVRFYAGVEEEDGRFVKAVYLDKRMAEGDKSGVGVTANHYAGEGAIRIVEKAQLPLIFDGGCLMINILYDVRRGEFKHVFCNGQA